MDKQTQKILLKKVRSGYEDIASSYSETRKRHMGSHWEELRRLADEVRPGDRVLDAGCGNGRLLEAFSGKPFYYLGVDQSEGLLAEAGKLHPGRAFRRGDILELSQVPEHDFDYVFSVAVLHHLPGFDLRLAALKQLKSKLRPGGKLIATVWNLWSAAWAKMSFRSKIAKFALLKLIGKNRMDFGDIVFPWMNGQGQVLGERYYHAFTRRGLVELARSAGFGEFKVHKDGFNYYLVAVK